MLNPLKLDDDECSIVHPPFKIGLSSSDYLLSRLNYCQILVETLRNTSWFGSSEYLSRSVMPPKTKPPFPPKEDGSFTTQTRRSQTLKGHHRNLKMKTLCSLKTICHAPQDETTFSSKGGWFFYDSDSKEPDSKRTPSESENEDTLLLEDSENNNKSANMKKVERSCG
ncbi:hypothetical protein GOBAR_AA13311 [Gossypium barbadense]|uniref:Uncharacterized protein n=1 Tax=Gossypium barbadense TaxID=3634 RepID=A0A2P5XVF3_GOSBA|nr:hypothetical protein GOBAR_AA13311 [Gossypium barbadense]